MSTVERHRSGGISTMDKALVGVAVVGGVLLVLWLANAVVGALLFGFKIVVLVVVVALIVRLVHALSRRS